MPASCGSGAVTLAPHGCGVSLACASVPCTRWFRGCGLGPSDRAKGRNRPVCLASPARGKWPSEMLDSCPLPTTGAGRDYQFGSAPQSRHRSRPRRKTEARAASTTSDLCLLGDLEGVIDFDAEVPHRRLKLGVPGCKVPPDTRPNASLRGLIHGADPQEVLRKAWPICDRSPAAALPWPR